MEIADDAEHDRADEVDDQVAHGVIQADIQIAAEAEALAVHNDILNV